LKSQVTLTYRRTKLKRYEDQTRFPLRKSPGCWNHPRLSVIHVQKDKGSVPQHASRFLREMEPSSFIISSRNCLASALRFRLGPNQIAG
jgi:hypothetical protein